MNKMNTGMAERYCALSIGILFLFIGLAGFVPAFAPVPGATASSVPADLAPDAYAAGFGYLFGLFPTNLMHNLVHCAVGLLGIAAYTSPSSTRLFNQSFAIAYALIAIMGLLPFTKTTFGLMPIFGNNVWFNALTAAVTAYYGFILPAKATEMSVSRNP